MCHTSTWVSTILGVRLRKERVIDANSLILTLVQLKERLQICPLRVVLGSPVQENSVQPKDKTKLQYQEKLQYRIAFEVPLYRFHIFNLFAQ